MGEANGSEAFVRSFFQAALLPPSIPPSLFSLSTYLMVPVPLIACSFHTGFKVPFGRKFRRAPSSKIFTASLSRASAASFAVEKVLFNQILTPWTSKYALQTSFSLPTPGE